MTRMDFLKQLEYLLQDIDEKDREDALEYYRDYMDEAGISEFASVDGMLDTPEKVAISIRASLNGDDEEQSEFSEQGVKDARWEPQKHMPDVYQKDGWTEAKTDSPTPVGRRHPIYIRIEEMKKGMNGTSGKLREKERMKEKHAGVINWARSC